MIGEAGCTITSCSTISKEIAKGYEVSVIRDESLKNKKNFIFLGDSGSGKTENALYFATKALIGRSEESIFFDMDQTKAIFRAREYEEILKEYGVKFMDVTTFLDAPVVPSGVKAAISSELSVKIFDVGGDVIGAKMIGQFSDMLNNEKTKVFYIINPYRPFSKNGAEMIDRMNKILISCHLQDVDISIISNPCLGDKMTAEDILQGHSWLKDQLKGCGYDCSYLSVNEIFQNEIKKKVKEEVLPLKIYIKYP